MNKQILRNKLKYPMANACLNIAALFLSGTLMQTFLTEIGVGELAGGGGVFLHASVLQAVNVISSALMSHYADRGEGLIRRMCRLYLPISALYLAYIPLCFSGVPLTLCFGLALAVGTLQTFFTALLSICEYRLPYLIIPVEQYGEMASFGGIMIGCGTMGVGALFSFLAKRYSYPLLMKFAFPCAAVLLVFSFFLIRSLKPIDGQEVEEKRGTSEKTKVSLSQMVRLPVFYRQIIPNLARGWSNGAIAVLAALSLGLGKSTDLVTSTVPIQAGVTFLVCILFGSLSRRVSPRLLVFIGALLAALVPLITVFDGVRFLLLFGFVYGGKMIVDYGFPTALYRVVPADIAGPYHAWRLILTTGGSLLSTTVAGYIAPLPLLISAASMGLLSGLWFLLDPVLKPVSDII